MYIRDYNKATTVYPTDAFIIDGSQETMYILASDLYEALVGSKGFITKDEVDERGYQTREEVNTLVEAKGYITALKADELISEKGYMTSDLTSRLIESYGYQNSSDVNRIIESKNFLTNTQVETKLESYVTDSDLESKNFQNENDVKSLINESAITIDSALSDTSENAVQNKVIKDYLNKNLMYLGMIHKLDSDLDSIASEFNVPDRKPYIVVNVPLTGEPYLHDGWTHVIIGMEYDDHSYGFQESHGRYLRRREKDNGVWSDWETITSGSDINTDEFVKGYGIELAVRNGNLVVIYDDGT